MAMLNVVGPWAWLVDVLARIAGISQNRLDELPPWEWDACRQAGNT
ncbi:transposase domain-containing protein [Ruegeria sp. EL01]|jgi:hypothetical protein